MGREFHEAVGIQANTVRQSLELGFGCYNFEGVLDTYPN